MNTTSFKPVFVILIIPYNKICLFFKNFNTTTTPKKTNKHKSHLFCICNYDQDMIKDSASHPVFSLSDRNCNPVNSLALSIRNH